MRGRGLSDASVKNHLSVIRSFFDTLSKRLDLPDPTRRLDEVRFHQKAPKRIFLTRREADVLLGAMEKTAAGHDGVEAAGADATGVRPARQREVARAIAARDHAAFSAMIYAGLRIERPRPWRWATVPSPEAPRRCGWRAARATRSGSCPWGRDSGAPYAAT